MPPCKPATLLDQRWERTRSQLEPAAELARSRLTEDGLDYLLKAVILKPCAVRIEVCRSFGAPPPSVEVVDQSNADAGFFERRIDARYRTHGHIVLMTLNDDEYCLHPMRRD